LGADRRIFSRLELLPDIVIRHIEWIEPARHESLQDYCKRLAAQVDTKDEFIFAGLSFGGLVALELQKILPAKGVILISTIATRNELPLKYRIIGSLKLHLLAPAVLMKSMKPVAYWIFNARTKKEKELLSQYLDAVSPLYLKWSLDKVLTWENDQKPSHTRHIHGTADRIFPYRLIHADKMINGGGHLMVYDRAKEVSAVITEWIREMERSDRGRAH